jgi:integrase
MKQRHRNKVKVRAAKSALRLPDLEVAKSAVLSSLSCPDAQRGYRHAIDEFVDWYCSEPRLAFNKTVVVRYRMHLESRHLAPGTINLRLGAVRRLAYEAADCGLLSADLAAGIRRVKGVKKLGVRLGNWLTAEQGAALWQAPDREQLKGKRDRALLSLLLSCGLRRHEVAELSIDHLQQRSSTALPCSVAAFCGAKWYNPCLRNVLILCLGTVKTQRQFQMLSCKAVQGKDLPKVPHGL